MRDSTEMLEYEHAILGSNSLGLLLLIVGHDFEEIVEFSLSVVVANR